MTIEIEYGKMWGQDDCRWAFCGSHYNFRLKKDLIEFYGIINSHVFERSFYISERGKRVPCVLYFAQATKNLDCIDDFYDVVILLRENGIGIAGADVKNNTVYLRHHVSVKDATDSFWKKLHRYVQGEVFKLRADWGYGREKL